MACVLCMMISKAGLCYEIPGAHMQKTMADRETQVVAWFRVTPETSAQITANDVKFQKFVQHHCGEAFGGVVSSAGMTEWFRLCEAGALEPGKVHIEVRGKHAVGTWVQEGEMDPEDVFQAEMDNIIAKKTGEAKVARFA